MAYFIKIPPHSDFEKGIFIPYGTLEEAERQVANDLLSTDFIESIVAAPYTLDVDEQGWPKHVTEHELVHELRALQKLAPMHRECMAQESADATTSRILAIDRIQSAIVGDGFKTLSKEDKAFAAELGLLPQNVAGRPGYTICSGGTATAGAIALSAATAKTVIGIAAGANSAPVPVEVSISFDGTSASAVPVLCEWVSGTNATNAPGTASTSQTPKQIRGWAAQSAVSTGAYNWTTEPTVLEVFKKRLVTPNGGLVIVQSPLDREALAVVTASTQFKFIGLRLTAPATVNVHVDLEWEE